MTARLRPTAARWVAGWVSLLLVAGVLGLLAPAARADSAPLDPSDPATPVTVTADGLPTVQVNGVVWSQVTVGNTVYAAGKFTRARPAGAAAGTSETVRNNLLAFDIRTGELITSFAPNLNAQALVVAASPDGSRIYVGGDFTSANGQTRNHVAAYDTATGALVSTFKPSVSSAVGAIAATNATVYLGGNFSAVGSVSRSRLAAVSASNGALLPWAPVPGTGPTSGNTLPLFDSKGVAIPGTKNTAANAQTSTEVMALVVTNGGSQVVAAGRFYTLNGAAASGVGALDAVSGATRPFKIGQLVTNQGVNSAIYSLSTDGSVVYGTGYNFYGPGNLEGGFAVDANGGTVRWINTCMGDSYSTVPMNGAVYYSSHEHDCSRINAFPEAAPGFTDETTRFNKFATAMSQAPGGVLGSTSPEAFQGLRSAQQLPWYPTLKAGTYTGQNQAGWSVSGNAQYVTYGGEFPAVNDIGQQGLVRFALPSIAPNKIVATPAPAPTATAIAPGTVRIGWRAVSDLDNQNLTYRVYRDGNETTPVAQFTRPSTFWQKPGLAYTDRGVSAGTHTYRVTASDPAGNRRGSSWVSVTTTGVGEARAYADTVHADGAIDQWSFSETSGATAYDTAGTSDATINSGVTRGVAGAIAGDGDTAFSFNGTSSGLVATKTTVPAPQQFSVEAWFSTTTTSGGKIVGFGSSNTGTSGSYDRHVYMDTAGRVSFGVRDAANYIVTSPGAYNDGKWHHVVASMSNKGLALYLDGKVVGQRTSTTMASAYLGYWRIGGDSSWSGAAFLNGKIDEVAVYPTALPADRIAAHFAQGSTGTAPNAAPTAAFTTKVTDLAAAFDATGSADPDGTIASYAWVFGDGSTGTGVTATHAYATPGTYPVSLTVTDDGGATAQRTASVTVTAPPPNGAPQARFTASPAGRAVALDASGSTDADGTVAGWSWAFGDGTTGSGVQTTHVYPADGTYTVALTVTDDDGATNRTEQSVTVAGQPVLASDAFGRTVAGGLGTADVGGAWTAVAGASRQSVKPGNAVFATTKGTNTGSYLAEVAQTDADVRTTVSLSAVPTGGGAMVYVGARRVDATHGYQTRLRFLSDGTVAVALVKLNGSTDESLIGSEVTVKGLTYTPGTVLGVRVQASGSGTTQLSTTVWPAAAAEPATPTLTRTDTTAALQAPGGVGLSAYLSGSATAGVDIRFGTFSAAPVAATAPANAAPTAAFTASAADLIASVDGSASKDADGTVASYAWSFGDGGTGSGATASHTYAAAGTYPVRLTVTDDGGATGSVEKSVTVTAPAPQDPTPPADPALLASDAFGRTVTGGLGTADQGGAWSAWAGASRQSVKSGAAVFAAAKGTNTGSFLGDVQQTSADVRTTMSLSAVPTGSGAMVYVGARRVGVNKAYQARVRILPDGSVAVALDRLTGTTDEALIGKEVVLSGVTYTAGMELNVRVQASGTGTTNLSATVWKAGTTEPTTPTVAGTDSTAELQAPGGVGLATYLSGSATAGVDVRFTTITAAPVAG